MFNRNFTPGILDRGASLIGNQHFLLPPQPKPSDKRPRNGFGFLLGFGKAAKAYYEKCDKANATKNRK